MQEEVQYQEPQIQEVQQELHIQKEVQQESSKDGNNKEDPTVLFSGVNKIILR